MRPESSPGPTQRQKVTHFEIPTTGKKNRRGGVSRPLFGDFTTPRGVHSSTTGKSRGWETEVFAMVPDFDLGTSLSLYVSLCPTTPGCLDPNLG